MWGKPLGNTKIQDNPCLTSTACLPLKDAVEHANYSSTAGPYDYCDAWAGVRVPACTACLSNLDNGFYLRNYITMLDTGCQQRPTNGSTLSIAGSPFDRRPVNATDPVLTLATIPLPDYGPVSLGARVGIAFGGLALILALVGFCIVLNGKRRRRAFLRTLERARAGHAHHYGGHGDPRGGDMLETPASQKPLTGWNADSPVSVAATESPVFTAAPRYFSPYSSVYNSPVSGNPSSAAQAAWPALVPQGHMSPPPPPFSQWPSPTQEKVVMQMRSEQRQNEIAVGLALGGGDGMNNNPYTNGSFVFPPPPPGPPPGMGGERRGSSSSSSVDRKGKRREAEEEAGGGYEMESPYSGGVAGRGGYTMPVEPEAPVLHHPGYGRQYLRAGR